MISLIWSGIFTRSLNSCPILLSSSRAGIKTDKEGNTSEESTEGRRSLKRKFDSATISCSSANASIKLPIKYIILYELFEQQDNQHKNCCIPLLILREGTL